MEHLWLFISNLTIFLIYEVIQLKIGLITENDFSMEFEIYTIFDKAVQ